MKNLVTVLDKIHAVADVLMVYVIEMGIVTGCISLLAYLFYLLILFMQSMSVN